MPSKKLTQAELREFRSQLAKLKAKDLAYTGKDIRKQQPTRHALRTIRKFGDVLSGSADVVKVPRGKGKQFAGQYARAGDRIAVPKVVKSERSRYDAKVNDIVTTWKVPGGTVKTRRGKFTMEQLQAMEGKNVFFSIYVRRGDGFEVYRRATIYELAGMFGPRSSMQSFSDWLDHVNVDYFSAGAARERDEDDEPAEAEELAYTKRRKPARTKRQRLKGRK